MPMALAQLQDLRDRFSDRLRPWRRSAEFWVRAADIYTSYKVLRGARARELAPPVPLARASEVLPDIPLRCREGLN
jgi:hypothetical protein